MSRLLGLLGASLIVLPADTTADEAMSCLLSAGELSGRVEEVRDLFAGKQETRELEDGYEFRFPGDGDWAARLFALIEAERRCCPFLTLELSFEPGPGSEFCMPGCCR